MTAKQQKLETLSTELIEATDAEIAGNDAGVSLGVQKREIALNIIKVAGSIDAAMGIICKAQTVAFSHYRASHPRPAGDQKAPAAVAWRNGFGSSLQTLNAALKPHKVRVAASYAKGKEECKPAAVSAAVEKTAAQKRESAVKSAAKTLAAMGGSQTAVNAVMAMLIAPKKDGGLGFKMAQVREWLDAQ